MAAPSGGGGGGGPVGFGNSFTGPAEAIESMGNGVWGGWSGLVTTANNTVEAFNFLSPNKGLIVDMGWTVNFDDLDSNKFVSLEVLLNGSLVVKSKGEVTSSANYVSSFPYVLAALVIPAQTEVIIRVGTDESSCEHFVTLVGNEI